MSIPDVTDFRAKFAVSSQISDERVQLCLDDALDEVRGQLGIEAFDEIFNDATSTIEDSEYLDENTTTTDETALRLSRVTRSVFYLTAADLVMNTNLRIRPSGIVKKEQDAGSPALNSGSQVINEFISVAEAKEYSGWLRGRGEMLLAYYVIPSDPTQSFAEVELIRG